MNLACFPLEVHSSDDSSSVDVKCSRMRTKQSIVGYRRTKLKNQKNVLIFALKNQELLREQETLYFFTTDIGKVWLKSKKILGLDFFCKEKALLQEEL